MQELTKAFPFLFFILFLIIISNIWIKNYKKKNNIIVEDKNINNYNQFFFSYINFANKGLKIIMVFVIIKILYIIFVLN